LVELSRDPESEVVDGLAENPLIQNAADKLARLLSNDGIGSCADLLKIP